MTARLSVRFYPADGGYYLDVYRLDAVEQLIDRVYSDRPPVGKTANIALDQVLEYDGDIVELSARSNIEDSVRLNADLIDTDQLEVLDLENVRLYSSTGVHLFLLEFQNSLHTLRLNRVTGLDNVQVSDSITALIRLVDLQIVDTDIGIADVILDLNALVQLERLVLISRQMNRLPYIDACTSLVTVVLDSRDTQVLDTLEDVDWSTLYRLQYLSVRGSIGGTVPGWIADLKDLRSLSLDHNELTGTVPQYLFSGELPLLQHVNLAHNALVGTLTVQELYIDSLDLSHNNLHGTVSNIEARSLVLSHNLFTSIHDVYIEEVLDISHNNIIGQLDHSYFYSPNSTMSELNIYGNDFGDITLPIDADTGMQFIYSKSQTVIVVGSGWQLISSDQVQDRAVYKKLY